MEVVYKYPLKHFSHALDSVTVALPSMAQVMDIAFQGDDLFLWALVDTNYPEVDYEVIVAGTGREIEVDIRGRLYNKTIHRDGFVWHFFVKMASL